MNPAPQKESSTFSQAEIDALFGGGGSTSPAAAAPAATPPAAAPATAASPEEPKPLETKPTASPPSASSLTEAPPAAAKPMEAPLTGTPPSQATAAETKPVEAVAATQSAAVPVAGTAASMHLTLPHNRSGLALLLASFLAGIAVTLVGIYCWSHPFFVPQTVLTAVARVRAPRPAPPPPAQRVFADTPLQVAAQFNSLEGFSITNLACTGYQAQGAELLPVITLVASETHTNDRLVCASEASVAEMSVNRLLQEGYRVQASLVSLPAFRQGTPTATQTWYLFALHKEPAPTTEARMTLFETEGKTVKVLEGLLKQGWHITQVVGRPLPLQTNYLASSTTMAAVFLERPYGAEP